MDVSPNYKKSSKFQFNDFASFPIKLVESFKVLYYKIFYSLKPITFGNKNVNLEKTANS